MLWQGLRDNLYSCFRLNEIVRDVMLTGVASGCYNINDVFYIFRKRWRKLWRRHCDCRWRVTYALSQLKLQYLIIPWTRLVNLLEIFPHDSRLYNVVIVDYFTPYCILCGTNGIYILVQDIFVILGAFLELGGGMRLMAFGSLISTVGITSLCQN
jgi:hypothetical protein